MFNPPHDPLKGMRERVASARAQLRSERRRPTPEQARMAYATFSAWVDRQRMLETLERLPAAVQPIVDPEPYGFSGRLERYNTRFFPK